MTANGWFQVFFFFALVLLCAKPLGVYMARVFERERTWADGIFRPIERLIYRIDGNRRDARDGLDRVCGGDAALQSGHDAGDICD